MMRRRPQRRRSTGASCRSRRAAAHMIGIQALPPSKKDAHGGRSAPAATPVPHREPRSHRTAAPALARLRQCDHRATADWCVFARPLHRQSAPGAPNCCARTPRGERVCRRRDIAPEGRLAAPSRARHSYRRAGEPVERAYDKSLRAPEQRHIMRAALQSSYCNAAQTLAAFRQRRAPLRGDTASLLRLFEGSIVRRRQTP